MLMITNGNGIIKSIRENVMSLGNSTIFYLSSEKKA